MRMRVSSALRKVFLLIHHRPIAPTTLSASMPRLLALRSCIQLVDNVQKTTVSHHISESATPSTLAADLIHIKASIRAPTHLRTRTVPFVLCPTTWSPIASPTFSAINTTPKAFRRRTVRPDHSSHRSCACAIRIISAINWFPRMNVRMVRVVSMIRSRRIAARSWSATT